MPRVPSSIAARMRCAAGQKRRWNSTPSVTPAVSQAAIIRPADARSIAMGFSHSTCTPRAAAAVTTASWVGCGVHTLTTSRPRSSSASTEPTAARDAVPWREPGGPCGDRRRSRRRSRCPRRGRAATWLAATLPQPTDRRALASGHRRRLSVAGAPSPELARWASGRSPGRSARRPRRPRRSRRTSTPPASSSAGSPAAEHLRQRRGEAGGQQPDHQADRHAAVADAGRELLGEPGRRRRRWARRSRGRSARSPTHRSARRCRC